MSAIVTPTRRPLLRRMSRPLRRLWVLFCISGAEEDADCELTEHWIALGQGDPVMAAACRRRAEMYRGHANKLRAQLAAIEAE